MKKLNKKLRMRQTLLRRRIIVTVLLVVFAGLGTLAVIVWTKQAKADLGYDPYFTLSTGPSKIRIFQPVQKSVENPSTFTASGLGPKNSVITLKVDGVTKGTTTSDETGAWSKSVSGVADGDHDFTATTSMGGPFTVIPSTNYVPGYSIVDLNTKGLVSASMAGVGTALYALVGNGGTNVSSQQALKVNDNTVYLIRQRSVTILDVAGQKATKTIEMSSAFNGSGEDQSDNGELFQTAQLSADGSKVYMLYSSSTSAHMYVIDTATQSLVTGGGFPAEVVAGATDFTLSDDSSKIYTIAYNSTELDIVHTADGTVATVTLGASARDITKVNSMIYVSKSYQDLGDGGGSNYIAVIDPGTDVLDDTAIDLGGAIEGSTIYASANKVYVASAYDTTLRVIDPGTKAIVGTISLPTNVLLQSRIITRNDDSSKVYLPLTDNTVAIVDDSNMSLTAVINPPSANYTNLHGILVHDSTVYTTYDRSPEIPGDILDVSGNPTKLFSSLAYANANATTNQQALPLSVHGVSAGNPSDPININPVQLSNTVSFAVGTAIKITGPTSGTTLDAANPTLTGTGPKNATIQLSINSGSPINVAVDGAGNWKKQVTLVKNKNNKITAIYNNTRSQLVLPSLFIFGSDIARNQVSVIDGDSGIEQNPIKLPSLGVGVGTDKSKPAINTSATINPNGQRYYLINTDFTPLVASLVDAVTSGSMTDIESQIAPSLQTLLSSQLGGIDVYSATQSRELKKRIPMPNGVIPVGMAVSPDGKTGMVSGFSTNRLIELIQGSPTGLQDTPLYLYKVNLVDNTLDPDAIPQQFTIPNSPDGLEQARQIAALVSLGVTQLTKPGVFSADSKTFYTQSGLYSDRVQQIDVISKERSYFSIPKADSASSLVATIGVQYNAANKVLYVSYLEATIGETTPTFTTGVVLIDTTTGQMIGRVPLQDIPLFNFAISKNGRKMYMTTVNLLSLINNIGTSIENPQGVLINSLPTFNLTIYDFDNLSSTARPITNTEIPYNIVLSPDDSKVFIPTLLQNVVHVYDVPTDTMDAGNAPIVLSGVSTSLATVNNVANTVIGTYTADAEYYVPPDATVHPQCPDCGPDDKETTNTITQYKFLPTTSTPIQPQSLSIPNQTVQVIKASAENALKSQATVVKKSIMRSWMVYIIYAAFVATLGATGYVIWRTNVLIGASEDESYM